MKTKIQILKKLKNLEIQVGRISFEVFITCIVKKVLYQQNCKKSYGINFRPIITLNQTFSNYPNVPFGNV